MSQRTVLESLYSPQAVEGPVYQAWEAAGAFRSRPQDPPTPRDRTFCIVIPPPNVTGALHLGHALNNTLQDMLVRYHRMRGFSTLWQPGTDHAGIATQAVVERRIREQEGKSRHDLGRDELVRRIWQWKDEYEARIIGQLKLMGCSCDWERNRFTLDDGLARAVRQQFFNLFRDGLIFRGKRLVNWDTELQTAVANDEVYYETVKGKFWHFKYPVVDPKPGEPEYVIIATTRPETMLGDTAVAVCPNPRKVMDDAEAKLVSSLADAPAKEKPAIENRIEALSARRETHLETLETLAAMACDGRQILLPLVERRIPLITDEWADPLLGSGCVKITPAHDPNDYNVGERHGLPMVNVLTPDGKIARIEEPDSSAAPCKTGTSENVHSDKYAGLFFAREGRERVLADLEVLGLVLDIEDRDIELGHSDRSKMPIEPFLSDQWFVRTGDIGEPRGAARASLPDQSAPQQSSAHRTSSEPRSSARENMPDKAAPQQSSAHRTSSEPRSSARENMPDKAAPQQSSAHRTSSEPRASARANMPGRSRIPNLSQAATLLTWTTYGTWLPGDERGSVSRAPREEGVQELRNLPGEPYDEDDSARRHAAAERMDGDRVLLDQSLAHRVLASIANAAERHGVELLALAIMPNHIHVLCQGEHHGAELLQLFKGNASSVLNKLEGEPAPARWWTKSGSRRRIRAGSDLSFAIDYVRNQGKALIVWSFDLNEGDAATIVETARRSAYDPSDAPGSISRAEARGSEGPPQPEWRTGADGTGILLPGETPVAGLAEAAMDAVHDGRVRIFPDRYSKSYLDWLGEKRDWCISRQLWWGHRIPVWHKRLSLTEQNWTSHILDSGLDHLMPGRMRGSNDRASVMFNLASTGKLIDPEQELMPVVPSTEGEYDVHVCAVDDRDVEHLERESYQRDEDVLDTWFSSALWPFSTLGWPDDTAHLRQYYPTTVLITSRDIITNWVARMVMFGLYSMGRVPFDHVYIHPKILDGRGETMSKSKGNGVDPVDIIHTHGADALRYTMADMTTETQDIRMPVEYVCPHCGTLIDQAVALKAEEQNRKSRGEKLERKLQPSDIRRSKCTNKDCARDFATQWADRAIKAELAVARETSDKFDIGRNFCNKLWNAARFALMNLEGTACHPLSLADLQPEDRWILARLSQTVRRYHELLAGYQFSASIKELREFFWDGLCDWYIELTKARLSSTAEPADSSEPRASARANMPAAAEPPQSMAQHTSSEPRASARANSPDSGSPPDSAAVARQVLAFCLDQSLRLLHPTVPFITERLWQHLNEIAPHRGLPGLAEALPSDQLVLAAFPPPEGYPSLEDQQILDTFERLQDATRGVRDLRLTCNVPPKDRIEVTVTPALAVADAFRAHAHIIRHMAGIGTLNVDPAAKRPPNAGSVSVHGMRIYVHGISDDTADRVRTSKSLQELDKQIEGKEKKLANDAFVSNAKAEVVQAERERLAELLAQRDTLLAHLAELGGV